MKKLMPHLAGVLFALFVLAVAVGIVSMSFKGLGWIFPNDLFDQAIGLVLFDVAAFTWFTVLVYKSESTAQYVFSLIGFLVGLLGTFGLIGIEVGISSGLFKAADMTRPLTYVFIAVFMGHLTLIYLFHGSAPHMDAKISLGIDKAKIVDEGRKQAEKALGDALPHLGAAISARLVAEVMKDLSLQPQMIEGKFLPLDASIVESPAQQEEKTGGLGAVFFNALQRVKGAPRKYEQAVPQAVPTVAKEMHAVENKKAVPVVDDKLSTEEYWQKVRAGELPTYHPLSSSDFVEPDQEEVPEISRFDDLLQKANNAAHDGKIDQALAYFEQAKALAQNASDRERVHNVMVFNRLASGLYQEAPSAGGGFRKSE